VFFWYASSFEGGMAFGGESVCVEGYEGVLAARLLERVIEGQEAG
jgi:hypothetical protein